MFSPTGLTTLAAATLVSLSTVPDSLRTSTLGAFDRYVRLTEQRIQQEVARPAAFMWIDRQSASYRQELMARLQRGEVVSAKLQTREAGKEIDVDGGMIHHWVGTVMLPGSLDRVRSVVQNYNHYADWFGPLIKRSQVLSQSGDRFVVFMRTEMQKVVTVTVDATYTIDYQRVGTNGLAVRSVANAIHIVDSPGTPSERRTPAEQTFGFLWRLNTYCSFREGPGGTLEQCESITLTRNIPFGLGPIIRPIVSGLPRETMEFTLGQVRKLVSQ